jgi:hypothetical protein
LGVNERIILKLILNIYDIRMWNRNVWFKGWSSYNRRLRKAVNWNEWWRNSSQHLLRGDWGQAKETTHEGS